MPLLAPAALAALLSLAPAAQPVDLLLNGGFAGGLEGWSVRELPGAKVIAVEVAGQTAAVSLPVEPSTNVWDRALSQEIDAATVQGHRLRLVFQGRSPQGCRVSPYVELNRDPWPKSISGTLKLTPEWREYTLEGAALDSYRPGQWSFGFHVAQDTGTVELTGIKLLDLDAAPDPAGPRATVEQPVNLLDNADFAAGLTGWVGLGDRLQGEVIEVVAGEFRRGVRLRANPPANADPWSVGFGRANSRPIRRGDMVYFRAWLRSPDKVPVTFIFELNEAPHTKDISQGVTLTPEWREYRFAGRAERSYPVGGAMFKFFLGHQAGTLELAGLRVENYGPAPGHKFDQTIDYWAGRPHDDAWKPAALARIEQIRKGDVAITVLDAAGRPAPNARVKVHQQRHAFRWGTAAPASRFVDRTNPDNEIFRQEVVKLFNTVTFENDLKWAPMSERTLQTVDQAIAWLHERDIEVRGHVLVWGSYQHLHQSVRGLRGEALRQAVEQHVKDYATRFRGKLYLWDVVNEAGSNTEVWDEIGWEHFSRVFNLAREADPQVRLAYNDYGILAQGSGYREKVAARIDQLVAGGATFDTLGIQGHMGTPLTPMPEILKTLDRWAGWGKDLEITEFDLGVQDDQIHGDWCRDFLIACFSHPKVTAFIRWGFWEGSHWRARDGGAMIRRDWSKRPEYDHYVDLVKRQWWTDETVTADAAGVARLRAFYGRHQVTVTAGGQTVEATLETKPGEAGALTVRLP